MSRCICDQCKTSEDACPANDAMYLVDDLRQQLTQSQADCAVMREAYEKYVKENCRLIRYAQYDGLGNPDTIEGKCGGYSQNYDELRDTCKECIAAYDPGAEYTHAPNPLLAELEKLRMVAVAAKEYRRVEIEQRGSVLDDFDYAEKYEAGNWLDRVLKELEGEK